MAQPAMEFTASTHFIQHFLHENSDQSQTDPSENLSLAILMDSKISDHCHSRMLRSWFHCEGEYRLLAGEVSQLEYLIR